MVRYIKSMTLRWIGHVERMEDERMPKRLMCNDLIGVRKRERPRKRWLQDLRRMRIRRWKGNVQDRDEWREIVKEAKTNNQL
ncbi:hypothetical protein C0J52_11262 [Blattella germanica]|nr:hypothetical protein C0J52_11262 [Blattella germanica]